MRLHKGIRMGLFALVLLLGTAAAAAWKPARAQAAEQTGPVFVAKTGETYTPYPDLSTALLAATAEEGVKTVYLRADLQNPLSSPLEFSGAVRLASIAEENGTWTTDCAAATLTRGESYGGALITVKAGGSLLLENVALTGGEGDCAAITAEGALTLGVGASIRGFSCEGNGAAVYASGMGASVVVNGGVITGNHAAAGSALYAENGAAITVSDVEEIETSIHANTDEGKGSIAVGSGASLTVRDGRISAEQYAVYVFSDAGAVSITRRPAVTGHLFLENGRTCDLTGYKGTPLTVEVSSDRPDGPIVTSADAALEGSVILSEPTMPETYYSDREIRDRFLRTVQRETGREYGYGGLGVAFSQRERGALIVCVEFSDGDVGEVSTELNGKSYPLTYQEGVYTATIAGVTGEIASWQLRSSLKTAEYAAIPFITVDRSNAGIAAPAGTQYLAEDGSQKLLPADGLIPNDLAMTEGVGTFYLGERGCAREVFVGEWGAPVDPEEAGGTLYDAELTDVAATYNTLTFLGAEGYEYALRGEHGLVGWIAPSLEDGLYKVLFRNLEQDAAYTLLIRRAGGADTLPSRYVEAGAVKSLSRAESAARTAFVEAYRNLLSGKEILQTVTGDELRSALMKYVELTAAAERVAKLPAIVEKAEQLRTALPQAFSNDWRAEHAAILALELSSLDNTTHTQYKAPAEAAVLAYHGMEAHVAEFLGEAADGVDVQRVSSAAQEMLAGDMQDSVMPKARRIATIEIEEWLVAARSKYDFADGAQDNTPQVKALNALRDFYAAAIGEQTGIALSDYEAIRRDVVLAKAKLFVQGYYERLLLRKEEAQFSREELSEALTSVMGGLDSLTEENPMAEYKAMLALYQSFGKLCLDAYLGADASDGMRALYASEKGRIEAYDLTQADDESLAAAEAWVDLVVKQAETKRELQLYYEGLFDPAEPGRLNASDLRAYHAEGAFEKHVESWFSEIESAEDDAGRAALLQKAERDVYAELASALLSLHYQNAYGEDAPEGMSQKNAAFLSLLQESKAEEKEIGIFEDEIECVVANAKLELMVLHDYLTTFEGTMSAEEALEAVYAAIEEAGKEAVAEEMISAKEAAAYEGMLTLYKLHAGLLLDGFAADYADVPACAEILSEARTALEAIAFGELAYGDDALFAVLRPAVDAAVEQARQLLEVRKYAENLIARGGVRSSIEGVLGVYFGTETADGLIRLADGAEKKRTAGYDGKLALYKIFRVSELGLHLEEQYAGVPEARLAALRSILSDANSAITAIQYEGAPEEEPLAVCERKIDGLAAAGREKIALADFFFRLTEPGCVGERFAQDPALQEALQNGYTTIDEATMSEGAPFVSAQKAAYAGMRALYLQYGLLALLELRAAYPAHADVLADAETAMQAVGPAEDRDGVDRAAEEIETILWDTDAALVLLGRLDVLTYTAGALTGPSEPHRAALASRSEELLAAIKALANSEKHAAAEEGCKALFADFSAYAAEEFYAAFPVLEKEFPALSAADLPALEEARSAFAGLTMSEEELLRSLLAVFAEKAPSYQNELAQNAFALMLLDACRKAKFEGEREAVLAQIEAYPAGLEADEALAAQVASLRAVAKQSAEAVEYVPYAAEGDNADPTQDAYSNGLTAALGAIFADVCDRIDDAVGADLLAKQSAALEAEMAAYAHSRLKEIAPASVEKAYADVLEETLAAMQTQKEGSLDAARRGLIAMREAYAKAVLAAYAELLGVEEYDASAIEAAESDAAKNAAMFGSLLAVYRAYAASRLKAVAPEFAEAAQTKLQALALTEPSDAALKACEDLAEAAAEDALAEDALYAFYGELTAAQGLGDALRADLEAAYTAIEEAPTAEKSAKKDAGALALAKAALQRFGRDHAIAEEEISAAQSALESENAGTMSEKVLSIEKDFLTEAALSALEKFAPAGDGFAATVRTAVESEQQKAQAAIFAAATLPAAQAAYETALGAVEACVRAQYSNALCEGLDAVNAAAFAERSEAISARGYEAVRLLMKAYAAVVILDARLDADDVALRSYQAEQLAAAETLTDRADDVNAFAETLPALKTLVTTAATHIRGERFLILHAYRPELAFDAIAASDYERLAEAFQDYSSLDDAAKRYLDEEYSAGYSDFGIRLQDERDKAQFEGIRAEARVQIEEMFDSESPLAVAARSRRLAELAAVRYLPLTDPDREGDYLHRMGALVAFLEHEAEADLRVVQKKEESLTALEGFYLALLENAQVRYADSAKAALKTLYEEAQAALRAMEPEDYTQDVEQIEAGMNTALRARLSQAHADLYAVPVVAVASGMRADGSGAGDTPGAISGLIENAGGMSGDTVLKMQAVDTAAPHAEALVGDKIAKAVYAISLERSGVAVTSFAGVYTVKLLMPVSLRSAEGLVVVTEGEDGLVCLETRVEGDFLVFETTHFSQFYVYGEREISLWWLLVGMTVLLVVELGLIVYLGARVSRKLRARRDTRLAACGLPMLAIMVPRGAVTACVVLGVLIALAAIAIAVLLVLLLKKPRAAQSPALHEQPTEEPAEEPEEEAEEAVEEPVVAPEEPAEEPEPEPIFLLEPESQPAPAEEPEPEPEPVPEEPAEEPVEEPIVEPAEEPVEEPIVEPEPIPEEPAEEPVEEPIVEPAEEPVEEPIVEPEPIPEEPVEEPEPVPEEVVEEPIEEPVVEPAVVPEEPAEEPVIEPEPVPEEPAEEPVVEPAVVSVEPAEEPVEEPIEQSVEEPIAEPEPVPEEPAEEPIVEPEPVPVEPIEEPIEEPVVEPAVVPEEVVEEPVVEPEPIPEEPAEEPVEEPEPVPEEPVETPAVDPMPAVVPVEAEMPEEYRLPIGELRVEVAASEVNALMQDTVAKQLIEEGQRVAARGKTGIVNVDTLGAYFENGERVTLEEIKLRVPYFNKKTTYVKILARGKLSKALIVEGDDFSLEAVKMIALTGGHVIRTKKA